MVDTDITLSGDTWLGMQCNAAACAGQHAEIVRAVTDSEHVLLCDTKACSDLFQRLHLGLAP